MVIILIGKALVSSFCVHLCVLANQGFHLYEDQDILHIFTKYIDKRTRIHTLSIQWTSMFLLENYRFSPELTLFVLL